MGRISLTFRYPAGAVGVALLTGFGLSSHDYVSAALAQTPAPAPAPAPAAETKRLAIVLVRETVDHLPPLSLLDIPPKDDGLAGAKLAIADNNTTGRFLKQEFILETVEGSGRETIVSEVAAKHAAGARFFVLAVEPETVVALADWAKEKDALFINAGAPDDRLREEDCRANVLHTAPTRTMLADALAQYLAWKRWRNWFLISGSHPRDKAYADALKRSAQRFGAKVVEERTFEDTGGSRRTDAGHEQVQAQIPIFTQNAPAHDVVVVADESELFGEYLPYRTWDPRPVAGTAGLSPMSWHPALEQWGATQFQNRFQRMAGRAMRPVDYQVWMAIRAIGEAATRRNTTDFAPLRDHLRSKEFELAAFKGQKLTFREWNGQLRQPVLVGSAKLPVTVSPQQGFLHQFSELDTLGIDRPESRCKL